MRNTTFLCSNVQTDECVATLGPIGCWFSMVGGGGGGGAAGPGADGRPTPPEGEGSCAPLLRTACVWCHSCCHLIVMTALRMFGIRAIGLCCYVQQFSSCKRTGAAARAHAASPGTAGQRAPAGGRETCICCYVLRQLTQTCRNCICCLRGCSAWGSSGRLELPEATRRHLGRCVGHPWRYVEVSSSVLHHHK